MTVVVINSGTVFPIPGDWTDLNSVECTGGSGSGGAATLSANYNGGGGAGSGGWSKKSNIPGLTGDIPISIAAVVQTPYYSNGTNGNPTWFGATTQAEALVSANGGFGGIVGDSPGPGAGGQGASIEGAAGDVCLPGSPGGAGLQFFGGGGAGAPGPDGLGEPGQDAANYLSGNGGAGDAGLGGAGGAGENGSTPNNGVSNPNGGGGGGGGNASAVDPVYGWVSGTGGSPGGGAGGAGGYPFQPPGQSSAGQIRITYQPGGPVSLTLAGVSSSLVLASLRAGLGMVLSSVSARGVMGATESSGGTIILVHSNVPGRIRVNPVTRVRNIFAVAKQQAAMSVTSKPN
jgi:hypothetical protein